MVVKIDVSNEATFRKLYNEFSEMENIIISEDNVSYGIYDPIIIGLLFVFESSLAGLTWDFVKEQILPYLKQKKEKKRSQDKIYVYIADDEEEYDIDIPDNIAEFELKIPKKLEMKIKK
jgi:hypothetical protein